MAATDQSVSWQNSLLSSVVILIVLLCLSLLAMQPFLTGRMPQTADGELHLYRILALDHSLRVDNPLWPRYSSGLVYGYGAPLFNYFSPLAFYPSHLMHTVGMSFQSAWLWAMALFTFGGAVGAYLLGRVWTDRLGGLVTAVAFIYAPYFLFDTVSRGTISETAALAMLPWVMWAFWRLAVWGKRFDFVLAVAIFTFFIPLHNIITLHGTALLAIYCLLLLAVAPKPGCAFLLMLLAGGTALAMTAFYWLPALAETNFVKIEGVTANLPLIDPANHLRSLPELTTLLFTADPTQLQSSVPIVIGLPQIILGIITLLLTFTIKLPKIRIVIVILAVLIGVLLFLNLESSAWVWDTLPLIGYTQFAWRTLGPASLLLAMLVGIGASQITARIPSQIIRTGWGAFVIAVMMLYAIPWLYTIYLPDYDIQDITDLHDMERTTGSLATSSFGEYVPVWNQEPLDPDRLAEQFDASENGVISRLQPVEGVTVNSEAWQGTSARLNLEVDNPTTLVFDWLYVPGWHAQVNGESVSVEIIEPEGLIGVFIGSGSVDLTVKLDLTSTQSTATFVSVFALLLALIVSIPGWRFIGDLTVRENEINGHIASYSRLTIFAAVGIILLALKLIVFDTVNTPLKQERFANGVVSAVNTPVEANFENQFVLLGADIPQEPIETGTSTIFMYLYWQLAWEPVAEDYSSQLILRDGANNIVMQGGSFTPGRLATSHWLPGYYVRDEVGIIVPCGTPPGTYTLEAGLFNTETLERLSVLNAAGNPQDDHVVIASITVVKPDKQTIDVPKIDTPYDVAISAAANIPREAVVGQEMAVLWDWVSVRKPTQDYQGQLVWLNDKEQVVASTPPVDLTYNFPTTQWDADELWTGRHSFYVPGDLENGTYDVAVQLLDDSNNPVGQPEIVKSMMVSTPARTFTLPDMEVPVDAEWQNGIHLKGYTVGESDTGIDLTLYWQTTTPIHESLRLFVHLLDSEDAILAQTDGIPVNWTRPTTGWAVGEVITTHHSLSGLPDTYRLRIGWYAPGNNVARVPLTDDMDFLLLP